MDYSYSQKADLRCPDCGKRFVSDVWLIVDAKARPDLIALIHEGTLNMLACPRGHVNMLDVALLVYRPKDRPRLIFSPPGQASPEEADVAFEALTWQLRQTLGRKWRDSWLDDAIPLPRSVVSPLLRGDTAAADEALMVALSEDIPPALLETLDEIFATLAQEGVTVSEPDELEQLLATRPELRKRLDAAVQAAAEEADDEVSLPEWENMPPFLVAVSDFIDRDSWLESYQHLLAHPELLTEEADDLLQQLINGATEAGDHEAVAVLGEHRDVLRRCQVVGVEAALAEKQGVTVAELLRMADRKKARSRRRRGRPRRR